MNYKEIRDFYLTPMKTLEYIRMVLKLKGQTYMFVKNQSKKYGVKLEADTVLTNEQADLIILNTLGKLNRVEEQTYYLRAMKNEAIREEMALNSVDINKARSYADKSNLIDTLVDLVNPFLAETRGNINASVDEVLKNEPNIEFIDQQNKEVLLKRKVAKIIKLYKEG